MFTDILSLEISSAEIEKKLFMKNLFFSGMEEFLENEKLVFANQMLITGSTPDPVITLLGTELVDEFHQEFHTIIGILDFTNGLK